MKISICWLILQMVAMAREGPAQSQESGGHPWVSYMNTGAQGIQAFSAAFPNIPSESWIGSGASRAQIGTHVGRWQCRLSLINLPHCGIGPHIGDFYSKS